MDVFDKILKEHSWKFPKGYPDINDEADKALLFSLVQEHLLTENSEVYDSTIKNALDVEEIPVTDSKYQWNSKGGSTFSIKVKEKDMDIFKKLYPIKPPKVGQEVGSAGSLGVGNGEIALYWLYNYSNSNVKVNEGGSGDDPDLFFNGVGVEVKAYNKHEGTIGLGRFGADKENLSLLSIIFGINALSKALGDGKVDQTINPTNFKGRELIPALEKLLDFEDIDDLDELAIKYPLFKTIKDNITKVKSSLGDFSSAEEGAIAMALLLLDSKLGRKPGNGGYLANIKTDGDIKFFAIDLEKLKGNDILLDMFKVNQSAILLKFSQLFG